MTYVTLASLCAIVVLEALKASARYYVATIVYTILQLWIIIAICGMLTLDAVKMVIN